MKILHVIPSVSAIHGGPTRALAVMEGALTRAGVDITTLTTDDGFEGNVSFDSLGSKFSTGATRVFARKWFSAYKFAPGAALWLWLNVKSYDVVHIHALFSFTSVAAATISFLRGVPYIIRPLGTLSAYGMTYRRPWLKHLSLKILEAPILRHASYIHCTSKNELIEAQSLGLSFNGGVIPLGIELEWPALDKRTRHARAILDDRLIILFLSRLDPKKNIESVLEALALLTNRYPNIQLKIAGDGPTDYVNELKSKAARLSVEKRVEWLGYIDGERKLAELHYADLFVLVSHSENFGIAAVEAMLASLPCILSEAVGVARIAEAENAARVVALDSGAIADALAQLIDNKKERGRIGENARIFAEREFSVDTMASRLVALYASLSRREKE